MSFENITSEQLRVIEEVHSTMMSRCYDEGAGFYASYGGRGITVCKEWQTVMGFARWVWEHQFPDWEKGFRVGRVDTGRRFEPDNCYLGIKGLKYPSERVIKAHGLKGTGSFWEDKLGLPGGTYEICNQMSHRIPRIAVELMIELSEARKRVLDRIEKEGDLPLEDPEIEEEGI